jgi:hypothetical protein
MTLREEIAASVSDAFVQNLHQLIEAQCDTSHLKDRLVHFLVRYERYVANTPTVTRNERRVQISRLHDKASGFLMALENLHPEIIGGISAQLNNLTLDERWENFDSFDPERRLPPDDDTLKAAKLACERIRKACKLELDLLQATKGAPKGSMNPSLDQIITDLAALYEIETGNSAMSHCYRDATVEDEFNGKFFLMTKVFLEEFAPDLVTTPIALGKRIHRVLQDK